MGDHGQRPIIVALPDPGPDERSAEREAWRCYAEGAERALEVSGLSAESRAKFCRRLRLARELAGVTLRDLRPERSLHRAGG